MPPQALNPHPSVTHTTSVSADAYYELLEQYQWLQTEYQTISSRFTNLKHALLQGGADEASIETLAQGSQIQNQATPGPEAIIADSYKPNHNAKLSWATDVPSIALSPGEDWAGSYTKSLPSNAPQPHAGSGGASWSHGLSPHDDRTASWVENISRSKTPHKERHTISISNLPSDVTHKEITSIIRGGRLVEVWLRRAERAASVTFQKSTAAIAFVQFARHCSLTLRGHRVEVGWSERQFDINSQLKDKLSRGHSRNLVIRGGSERLTDDQIRADMDHVHNLIITAVVTHGQDIFVSTNSVGGAQFAYTCMRSRKNYKPFKIEWYPDECDEPLPEPPTPKFAPVSPSKPKAKPQAPPRNRFDLLDMVETLDESSDDASSDISGVNIKPRSAATKG